jgi:hypothetical protein
MKHFFSIIALLIVISSLAFAQEGKMTLGLGAEIVLPSGTFGDVAGTGFGGTVNFLYDINDQIAISGTAGYLTWGKKSVGVAPYSFEYTYSAIPILAGARYYFTKCGEGLYGSAEIGFYMFSVKFKSPGYTIGGVTYGGGEATESSSEFAFAPGIGYEMPISDVMNFDALAKYVVISDMGNIDFRVGINYKLN